MKSKSLLIAFAAVGCFAVGCNGNLSHNHTGTGAQAAASADFQEMIKESELASEKAEYTTEYLQTFTAITETPETCENASETHETTTTIQTTTATTEAATMPTETATQQTTEPVIETQLATLPLTQEEQYLLLLTASCEAGGQGPQGLALVMRIILNRASLYGCSIKQVIYSPGQFAVVGNDLWNAGYIVADAYTALAMIQAGWNESQGALYFCTPAANSWHRQALTYLFTYGDHEFYR